MGVGGGGCDGAGNNRKKMCGHEARIVCKQERRKIKLEKKNRLHGGAGGVVFWREKFFFFPVCTFYLKHKLIKTFLVSRCQNFDTPTNRTLFLSVNGFVTYL